MASRRPLSTVNTNENEAKPKPAILSRKRKADKPLEMVNSFIKDQ